MTKGAGGKWSATVKLNPGEYEFKYRADGDWDNLYSFDRQVEAQAELGVIQLRSASRVGRSDLGVNAKRVARLRGLFEQRQALGGVRI